VRTFRRKHRPSHARPQARRAYGTTIRRRGSVNRGSMTETLRLRPAVAGDLSTIFSLIEEARTWLPDKGTDQWAEPWPSAKALVSRVRRDLNAGKTWLVEDGGTPVATITCSAAGNRRLWPLPEQAERAVYVARLIVKRSHAGQRIGEALVDWAGVCSQRVWGAKWIRIDVWTDNEALHNYYEKRGFKFYTIREFVREYCPSAALFQKPTEEADEEALSRFTWSPATEPGKAWPANGHPAGRKWLTHGRVGRQRPRRASSRSSWQRSGPGTRRLRGLPAWVAARADTQRGRRSAA
jgi:ribosomal protein S18 acetylase RimI-like enzyme